jgi:hypothetical protein
MIPLVMDPTIAGGLGVPGLRVRGRGREERRALSVRATGNRAEEGGLRGMA